MKPSKMPAVRKAKRDALKVSGMCIHECGVPAVLGKTECERCTRQNSVRTKNRFASRKGNNLCVTCTKIPPVGGSVQCRTCLDGQSARYENLKKDGRCGRCSEPNNNGKVTCDDCRTGLASEREIRVTAGMCIYKGCTNRIEPGKVKCDRCRARGIVSMSRLYAKKNGHAPITLAPDAFVEWYFRRLAELNGFCAWCSEPFGKRGPIADHDHRTGEVRDVICNFCNTVEGYGLDRIDKVLTAIEALSPQIELMITFEDTAETRRVRRLYSSLKCIANKSRYAPVSMSVGAFVNWYTKQIAASNGLCAWCSEVFGKRGPIADHCHVSGAVRALVCHPCNVVEGFGVKRLKLVRNAIGTWNSNRVST